MHHMPHILKDSWNKTARHHPAGQVHERTPFDGMTVFELKLRAKDLGLQGYSDKTKAQLIDLVRHHCRDAQDKDRVPGQEEVPETGTSVGDHESAPEGIGESA